jgi:hypothetical protein
LREQKRSGKGWRMTSVEAVINAVRKAAPGAAIAFNTRPENSADADARWLQAG